MKVDLTVIKPRGCGATDIEWADYSANPIRAIDRKTGEVGWHCRKVSAGCANCYAEVINKRFGTRHGFTASADVDLVLDDGVLERMLSFRPKGSKSPDGRPKVFLGDMNDLFYGDDADRKACEAKGVEFKPVPFEWLDRIFAVCALRPDIDWLFLTKRPGRMAEYFARPWAEIGWDSADSEDMSGLEGSCIYWDTFHRQYGAPPWPETAKPWPLPNVWLGASCENQAAADERIPELQRCPAAVWFLSCEPLIGPVELGDCMHRSSKHHMMADVEGLLAKRSKIDYLQHPDGRPMTNGEARRALEGLKRQGVRVIPCVGKDECPDFDPQTGCPGHRNPRIDWVIVGGESGHGSRTCNIEQVRSIVRQCADARAACFVKQLGKEPFGQFDDPTNEGRGCQVKLRDPKGGDPAEWPEDLRVREWPSVNT